jgi:multidrug efflux pump subunit AcrB
VKDDNLPGRDQLQITLDHEAVRNAGLNAAQVARLVRLAVDGEVVAFTRDGGDKVELRVRSDQALLEGDTLRVDPDSLLDEPIALPDGSVTRLGALVQAEAVPGRGFIRHYNLRRTTTVEANLDKEVTDTKVANDFIKAEWENIRVRHPGIDLDFSGELEDIEESLAAMQVLFLLGLGLIYLILAAQFKSYFQPMMILVTVPLAFTGVAFGLAISNNPLSLYTLYGVIALTGIAVNSAIVLIDAANDRLEHPGRPAPRGACADHHHHHDRRPVCAGLRHWRQESALGAGGGQHRLGSGVLHPAHTVRGTPALPGLHAAQGRAAEACQVSTPHGSGGLIGA